jgi:arylamine N-acetyltransferase
MAAEYDSNIIIGPTEPLELKDGYEMPWGSTPELVRLIHAPVPEFTDPTSKVWILQHKRVSQDWKDVYIFTETEFLPQDTKVMNYSTTFDVRGSFFNHMVICTRTVMENESVVGTLSLVNGVIKRRTYNVSGELRSEIVAELRNEVDRWEALEEWFGITLGEGERAGIRGLVTELKMKAGED